MKTADASTVAKPVKVPPHQQPVAPPPPITTGTYRDASGKVISQALIDASLAANPQASKGGYEGVGTPEHPGPAGTTNYGNPSVTQTATADPSKDWAQAFFGALGLPDDVMSAIIGVLRDHAQDPALAQALATQYVRSTPWYAIHYPGALEGIAKGVIGSEADYSNYLNQINVLSKQYQGRDISGDEIKGYLASGYNPGYVANLFQGKAYVSANRNDLQYLAGAFGDGRLDEGQLTALGNEQAGIDSPNGLLQRKIIAKAQQIHDKLFSGTLATPSLSLGPNGLSAPSIAGKASAPDIGA